jgi:hypothetical protein
MYNAAGLNNTFPLASYIRVQYRLNKLIKMNVMKTKFTIMLAAGLILAATTTQAQGTFNHDGRGVRYDRTEIRNVRRDIRNDRRDIRFDRRDPRFDRRCF